MGDRDASKHPTMHRAVPTRKNYHPKMSVVPRLRNPGPDLSDCLLMIGFRFDTFFGEKPTQMILWLFSKSHQEALPVKLSLLVVPKSDHLVRVETAESLN